MSQTPVGAASAAAAAAQVYLSTGGHIWSPQERFAKVDDMAGSKAGVRQVSPQGVHCDHTSSLVMSRMPEMFCGGVDVPTERLKMKTPAVSEELAGLFSGLPECDERRSLAPCSARSLKRLRSIFSAGGFARVRNLMAAAPVLGGRRADETGGAGTRTSGRTTTATTTSVRLRRRPIDRSDRSCAAATLGGFH
ncbi:hypothetical protein U9M48_025858 [Paspalum notatum var. saurae]|uniref:Uncharacterized protein n=1 Tax=Paspalum notatum var. saurae TaxID=547442 RepID=A0AAQ3TRC3_PASNO